MRWHPSCILICMVPGVYNCVCYSVARSGRTKRDLNSDREIRRLTTREFRNPTPKTGVLFPLTVLPPNPPHFCLPIASISVYFSAGKFRFWSENGRLGVFKKRVPEILTFCNHKRKIRSRGKMSPTVKRNRGE